MKPMEFILYFLLAVFLMYVLYTGKPSELYIIGLRIKKGANWDYANGVLSVDWEDYDISDIVEAYYEIRKDPNGMIEYNHGGIWYHYEDFYPTKDQLVAYLLKS